MHRGRVFGLGRTPVHPADFVPRALLGEDRICGAPNSTGLSPIRLQRGRDSARPQRIVPSATRYLLMSHSLQMPFVRQGNNREILGFDFPDNRVEILSGGIHEFGVEGELHERVGFGFLSGPIKKEALGTFAVALFQDVSAGARRYEAVGESFLVLAMF